MTTTRIAVSGATGRLGGRVARRLSQGGVAQRLIVRDPERAPRLPDAEIAQASYSDPAACVRALQGIGALLMVSGEEAPDRVAQHKTFVDAAAEAGVRHLVYTSFYGASPQASFTLARDHYATEQWIVSRGLSATFLRDNMYLDFMPFLIGADGVTRGPAGDGRVAAVAQDDIADAAVAVLLAPDQHSGATYSLTGPESLTLHEIAEQLTKATGRTVTYHPETLDEAYASRAGTGADWQLDAWVSTYTAIANGELATVTGDVQSLTGHPPLTLRQLLANG